MARMLDLTQADYPWRQAPMPGSNMDLDMVRLDADAPTFAILGRFGPGFERLQRGGYHHAEEFIVLDGYLELEGIRLNVGDLTLVPPIYLRTRMLAPEGCTVLAWFGGPAIFRDEQDLGTPCSDPIVTVPIRSAAAGTLLTAPESVWTKHDSESVVDGLDGELIDVGLTRWQRIGAASTPEGPFVSRVQR